ncbi:hypothetical protein [Paenibacillus lutrae]|uniref:hypothetical protein n=1 Tax=Paenibacillus lutrae TaxID=2078573 RepID=UPI001F2D3658|nr:hypothetical protein [Paenibacillus lutrae]
MHRVMHQKNNRPPVRATVSDFYIISRAHTTTSRKDGKTQAGAAAVGIGSDLTNQGRQGGRL